ncbi:biopolymer transporter ExbD [Aeromonas rivipollensis]|uniref:ExbD/TolR family protein n=1 Tax=Aeromonas rivipollensis TaxID=948519 RepID=UPI00259ED2A9|nr:biopolymer transporter ExbD [Aeromonas rivipollensis]MDM5083514.1 biopolymer transporter ExbD [Aeromonas rivipollensis]MDM5095892.1 biopolymer transporter ExbD [Aeromonas rivipollensis]MDM5104555.1 biopolymer transporter ExbD [Aeromonas rivipollensis]
MAFGKLPGDSDDQPLSEINMIPMIDVMLVLLIVFMITAPLLTNAVKLELPEASSQVHQPRQKDVVLSIDGAGKIYWNDQAVDEQTLLTRMSEAGETKPEIPEIQLRIDKGVEYGLISRVMAQASRHGLHKIAFVSQPEND